MSHVVKQDIVFGNLEAVRQACLDLGWTFMQDQKTYAWWGHSVGDYALPAGRTAADLGHCTHAIKVPGCSYEIGLIENPDGTFFAEWDFYPTGGLHAVMGNQKEVEAGKGGAVLKGAYAAAASKIMLAKKGFRMIEDRMVDGQRRLKFARAAQH